jgi:FHA domain
MREDDSLRTLPRGVASPRSARDPQGRLRAVHPLDLHWVIELDTELTVVGRLAADGTPGLTHGTVSRRHFELRWDAAQASHVGRDMGSHNGSRVGGRDLGPVSVSLCDGSVIQLGDVTLVYERIPPPLPASGPRRGDLLLWLERLHTAWIERQTEQRRVETLALTPEAVERILLYGWRSDLEELARLVHELASDPDLPRPIPLERLPAWLLGSNPDEPTVPMSGPPKGEPK